MDRDSRLGDRLLVRTYRGRAYAEVLESYWRDAADLEASGNLPVGQHYAEGNWGAALFLLSLITIPLLVGIAAILYMATNRPVGTLTVTYVMR